MKKTIALLLVVLQFFAVSAAAIELNEEQKADLYNLGIMTGDETGDLRLEASITRAEMIKMLCVAGHIKPQTASGEENPFPDVSQNHWAAAYIQAAKANGIVIGDENGYFRPESPVTNEEVVKMIVCLLGYEPMTVRGGYPAGYKAVAAELGITENLQLAAGTAASRNDVGIMIHKALDTPLMIQKQPEDGVNVEYMVLDGKNGVPLSTLRNP